MEKLLWGCKPSTLNADQTGEGPEEVSHREEGDLSSQLASPKVV